MIRKVKETLAFCKGGCWKVDIGAYGFFRRVGVKVVRFFSTTFKSFSEHRCSLHAASLTYFTILGFVPVLCLLMVCAKMCGLGDDARKWVNDQIDPLLTHIEKGKEEAKAAAVEVASHEKVEAVLSEAEPQKIIEAPKTEDPAPSEAAESPKKEDAAPPEAGTLPKKEDATASETAESPKKEDATASETAESPKKEDAAPSDAAESSKKGDSVMSGVADLSKTLVTVPVLAEDKEKTALYKARASQELATQMRKFSNEMFDVIDKIDLTTLGWIGFAVLMWTVVSTLGHVETAVNEVWHVKVHRPIWRKFIVYLFIVVALPLFTSLAVSMPILRLAKKAIDAAGSLPILRRGKAALDATGCTNWIGETLDRLLSSRMFAVSITVIFSSLAIAVLLKMMPNRRVGFRSALYAGFFTAALVGGWLVLCTTAGVGIAKSGAMYGSFAAVPIVLAWIYVSWQIVLLGSCMSYAFECVHRGSPELSDS